MPPRGTPGGNIFQNQISQQTLSLFVEILNGPPSSATSAVQWLQKILSPQGGGLGKAGSRDDSGDIVYRRIVQQGVSEVKIKTFVSPQSGGAYKIDGVQIGIDNGEPGFVDFKQLSAQLAVVKAVHPSHLALRLDKNEHHLNRTIIRMQNSGREYMLQSPDRRTLGSGQDGKVRIAFSATQGTAVAVKKNESVTSAEKEFLVYQKLGAGRHFPSVFDIAHTYLNKDIKSYIFMELINGEDGEKALARIAHGGLSESDRIVRIKHIARQFLEAMADMHDRGVSQRDMAPSNFMMEPSGNIKLIDFGTGAHAYSPQETRDPVSAAFRRDGNSISGVLNSFCRSLMELRSAYSYDDDDYDSTKLDEDYGNAVEAASDSIADQVMDLEKIGVKIKSGETTARQALAHSYFAG
jgi:serine/threonine protein kinase